MPNRSVSAAIATCSALLLAASVAGCTPTAPAPSASPSASASASPSAGATPSSSPTATSAELDCASLVDPATSASFAAAGETITPPAEFSAKLHDEGNYFAAFFDGGGILCQVGGELRATEMYGFAPMGFSSAAGQALAAGLLADGYAQTSGDGGEYFELPADAESVARACYLTASFAACALTAERLDEVIGRGGA